MADEILRDDTGAEGDMDDEETGTASPILTDDGKPVAPEDAEDLDSDPSEEGMAEGEDDEEEEGEEA